MHSIFNTDSCLFPDVLEMAKKGEIKNVQARIPLVLYEEFLKVITQWNEDHSHEEKLTLQRAVVEALNQWVRSHQKQDPFLNLSGIVNTEGE